MRYEKITYGEANIDECIFCGTTTKMLLTFEHEDAIYKSTVCQGCMRQLHLFLDNRDSSGRVD